jgi:hypothetical protein
MAVGHPVLRDDEYVRNGVAEIKLSVYKRQCLPERIPTLEEMRALTRAWNEDRNSRQSKVDWQFSTKNAWIKLKRLSC